MFLSMAQAGTNRAQTNDTDLDEVGWGVITGGEKVYRSLIGAYVMSSPSIGCSSCRRVEGCIGIESRRVPQDPTQITRERAL